MALYSYLSYKSGHDPTDLESHVIDSIDSRFAVPIAWLALFESDQIDSNNFIAVASTRRAIETIKERSPDLQLALGKEWQKGVEGFIKRLSASKYVELNLQDWFGKPAEFEGYMESTLSTFSEPFFTGEKHIFSRKMKVSKLWKENVLELYPSVGIFE